MKFWSSCSIIAQEWGWSRCVGLQTNEPISFTDAQASLFSIMSQEEMCILIRSNENRMSQLSGRMFS